MKSAFQRAPPLTFGKTFLASVAHTFWPLTLVCNNDDVFYAWQNKQIHNVILIRAARRERPGFVYRRVITGERRTSHTIYVEVAVDLWVILSWADSCLFFTLHTLSCFVIRHFQSVDIFAASFFCRVYFDVPPGLWNWYEIWSEQEEKRSFNYSWSTPHLSPLKAHSTVWAMYKEREKNPHDLPLESS